MCGILFLEQYHGHQVGHSAFKDALAKQSWRGPDSERVVVESGGRFLLGHNRLSIIDPNPRSDQPMRSACGRYLIVFNGEIYNHKRLRKSWGLGNFKTESDTETILEGFSRFGTAIFSQLDGMFALVVLDCVTGSWVAARDPLGIKPLYIFRDAERVVIASEPAVISGLVGAGVCEQSLHEWCLIRRPLPGFSFFKNVKEVLPGRYVNSCGVEVPYWSRTQRTDKFEQEELELLILESVRSHELSDCTNVALLSGGLDSSIITALSSVDRVYSVGLTNNNEFDDARDTADFLSRKFVAVELDEAELQDSWAYLARLRGEPLSVPNEGLIWKVCSSMRTDEKVVLTGEGADELFFGYDNIFRWGATGVWAGSSDFLKRYGYASTDLATDRLLEFIEALRFGKSTLDFVEDFFFDLHLTGLLRRMDFSSMAASREARVPFVTAKLVDFMYRRPQETRINLSNSKLPLREFAKKLGLEKVLKRKKIGFSASTGFHASRIDEYGYFRACNLKSLGWDLDGLLI